MDRDRRDFLRTLGRYLTFGGLLAGTGALVSRKGNASDDCTRTTICPNCKEFSIVR